MRKYARYCCYFKHDRISFFCWYPDILFYKDKQIIGNELYVDEISYKYSCHKTLLPRRIGSEKKYQQKFFLLIFVLRLSRHALCPSVHVPLILHFSVLFLISKTSCFLLHMQLSIRICTPVLHTVVGVNFVKISKLVF